MRLHTDAPALPPALAISARSPTTPTRDSTPCSHSTTASKNPGRTSDAVVTKSGACA
jgi:hypothetical protein